MEHSAVPLCSTVSVNREGVDLVHDEGEGHLPVTSRPRGSRRRYGFIIETGHTNRCRNQLLFKAGASEERFCGRARVHRDRP